MIFLLAGLDALRDDPVPPFQSGAGPVGFGTLLQMLLALGLVAALIRWLVPKLALKFSKRVSNHSSLQVEATAAIGAQQIAIVRVRDRAFLVGTGSQSVNLIAELTEEPSFAPARDIADSEFGAMMEQLRRLTK